MIVTFSAKDFKTGVTIRFSFYKFNGALVTQLNGIEIGDLWVYYVEVSLKENHAPYICLVREMGSTNWRDYKVINKEDI